LWDLAHLPKLSPHLVELALHEHHSILSEAYLIKDALKKTFILRCIEDIKKVIVFFFITTVVLCHYIDIAFFMQNFKNVVFKFYVKNLKFFEFV